MRAFKIYDIPDADSEAFSEFIDNPLQELYKNGSTISDFYHECEFTVTKAPEVERILKLEKIPIEFQDDNEGVMLVIDFANYVVYLISPGELIETMTRCVEGKAIKMTSSIEWYEEEKEQEPLTVTCRSCQRMFDYNEHETICPYCNYDNSCTEDELPENEDPNWKGFTP